MKHLYIFAAIVLIAVSVRSQNLQNANWYFGQNAGLSFLPNATSPVAITNSAMYTTECAASVSDQNGNLLFYTDGNTVWNNQNQVMTNGTGLMGHFSNLQGAVIVPRPGYPNNYYLVTIDGITGELKGLYYSEIDMSSGFGQVLTSNKNTVLYDHSAVPVPIDIDFYNFSEKLTSTKHSNGVDYWVITQIADQIYSYLVTSSGISPTPVASPALLDQNVDSMTSVGQMKISPDMQRIGVSYYLDSIVITGTNWGALALGDFNNTTGVVTFDPNLITIAGHYSFYGMEFSPNSQLAYFTTQSSLNSTTARSTADIYANIYSVDASKSSGVKVPKLVSQHLVPRENEVKRTVTPVASLYYPLGLQLAINGRIYVSDPSTNLNSYLSVINDPNNASNPGYSSNTVFSGNGIGNSTPQWVHWHKKTCPGNITRSTPELYDVDYVYADYIITNNSYSIPAGMNITMQAGNYILLQPNSSIAAGSTYLAFIEDCSQTTQSSFSAEKTTADAPLHPEHYGIIASPNPTSGKLQLTGMLINDIYIYDMLGNQVHNKRFDSVTNAEIDISHLQDGMYLIKVVTGSNTVENVRIIKK
jgi:hypothetical protein